MNPKEIVRAGYDRVSYAYRGDVLDWNDPVTIQYASWVSELSALIPSHSAILDLGCGNGIPMAKLLVDAGFALTGVDISPVQVARAQRVVPGAHILCTDMTELTFPAHAFAAIVSLYALIHVPITEQPGVLARMYEWLQPGGYVLAIVGVEAWTGTEDDWLDVVGGKMYWSHADTATYQQWWSEQGFQLCWTRFIPEGDSGHTLLLAQKPTI